MHKKLVFFNVALAVILLFTFATVSAQPTDPYPIGEITLKATQVSAGIGWTWGKGTMMFKGKAYPFAVEGLKVAAVGFSTINAKGDVYNLKNPSDLAGKYLAAGAGAALVKGKAGLIMRNEKGVVINLIADQEGVQLNLGADGLVIAMK